MVGFNQEGGKAASDRAMCGAGAATPFPCTECEVGQLGRPQQQLRPREREAGSRERGAGLWTRGRARLPAALRRPRSAARTTLWPPAAPARPYLSSHSNERRLNRLRNIARLGYPERVEPWLCAGFGRGKLRGERFVHLCWEAGETLLCTSDC